MKNLNLIFGILLYILITSCNENDEQLLHDANLMSLAYTQEDETTNKEVIDSINMAIFNTTTPEVIVANGKSMDEVVQELMNKPINNTAGFRCKSKAYKLSGPYFQTVKRKYVRINKKYIGTLAVTAYHLVFI